MNKVQCLIAVITLSEVAMFSVVYYLVIKKTNELRDELMQKIKNAAFSTAVSFEKLEASLKNERKSPRKPAYKKNNNSK